MGRRPRCARFPAVEMIALARNPGGVARNYGVRHLRRDYIAFADDDSWWAPGSGLRTIAFFDEAPTLALLMARSPLPHPADVPGVPVLGFLACGALVRRDPFLAVGGFDPRFGTGGEEALVAMTLAAHGWHLAYGDDLIAHHHPSPHRPNMRERYIEGISDRLWEAGCAAR